MFFVEGKVEYLRDKNVPESEDQLTRLTNCFLFLAQLNAESRHLTIDLGERHFVMAVAIFNTHNADYAGNYRSIQRVKLLSFRI